MLKSVRTLIGVVGALLMGFGMGMRAQTVMQVASPDGKLVMQFGVTPGSGDSGGIGKLVYSMQFRGKPVVDESALALELGGTPLGSKVRVVGSAAGSGVDDYTLLNQKASKIHDAYNSLALDMAEDGGRKLRMEARAYNGGVAFRYVIPETGASKEFHLKQEDTEFRLSMDATDWALLLQNFRSPYEAEYVKLPTSALRTRSGGGEGSLVGMPLLMHEPGVAWLALMEADIEGNSSMYVTNPSASGAKHFLQTRLSPRVDRPEVAVEGTLPHHSAWRVLLVADEPGRLVESTIQYDLNPPSRLTDTSWIHAGKASWDWWADDVDASGKPSFTTATMKYYEDFSAASGFPYFLLDEDWETGHGPDSDITKMNGKVDIPELVRYGATKNVKVWIWCHSGAVAKHMAEAFPLYEKWGVVGVKIDFIERDDQDAVEFYYDVAREAAKHHLMVDFHGTRTPWGMERTYPNVLTYEGVLGAEYNKMGRRDNPEHRVTLPFTRALAGPMDYTPGGFNNVTEEAFVPRNTEPLVMGTRAQQLALYVLLQTPFQMVSDSPQAYAGRPEFQFIKDVPASWDETRVVNGIPGQYATIARRSGTEWDLGSMTDWEERTISVPLKFLGMGSYTAEIYEDAADASREPTHVVVRKQTVTAGETMTLKLAAGGGCAIRFVPKRKG